MPARASTATQTVCPQCGSAIPRVGLATVPWCTHCRWNLDAYDPAVAPYRGTKLLSRWGYRRGRRLDERLLRELGSDSSTPSAATVGRVWLMAVSALIVLLMLACLAGVVWAWVTPNWSLGIRILASLLLFAAAAALAPRFLAVPKATRLADGQGIELRRLVNDVAAAVGAAPPDAIVFDMRVNAAVARFGWRQQTLLVIGVPLWLMLTPQARISVLAHEFGHVVNNDPMRSVLTLPARSFGARAVAATGGRNPWLRALEGAGSAAWHGGTLGGFAGIVLHAVLALVNTVGAALQLMVDSVAMPDSRRAEFLADLKAREVGGSKAFIVSSERLLIAPGIWQDLWDQAPRIQPEELVTVVERSAARRARDIDLLRQASRREVDLWSSHPCEDDRMTLVEQRPVVIPTLQLGDHRWASIDAELSQWYAHLHKTLLGTRDRIDHRPAG